MLSIRNSWLFRNTGSQYSEFSFCLVFFFFDDGILNWDVCQHTQKNWVKREKKFGQPKKVSFNLYESGSLLFLDTESKYFQIVFDAIFSSSRKNDTDSIKLWTEMQATAGIGFSKLRNVLNILQTHRSSNVSRSLVHFVFSTRFLFLSGCTGVYFVCVSSLFMWFALMEWVCACVFLWVLCVWAVSTLPTLSSERCTKIKWYLSNSRLHSVERATTTTNERSKDEALNAIHTTNLFIILENSAYFN